MWSLFKLMTLDGWVHTAEKVIGERPSMMVFFILFVFCASIAIMSLVPAIFIELHMDAKEQEEKEKKEKADKDYKDQQTKVLNRLFRLTDADNSGAVSQPEIEESLNKTSVIEQLCQAGLMTEGDLKDAQ